MKAREGQIRAGISNVVVPGNKTTFPPAFQQKSRLHYYSTLFNTVEINSSFYKTPLLSTFQKWSLDVPDDFQFTLKLSRDVTHTKNLQPDFFQIDRFLKAAAGIGNKKGCLLIQFPGKITLEYYKEVEAILLELETVDVNGEWKKAVEFRHESWYTGETWEMLNEFHAAMVLHDKAKSKILQQRGNASFVYLRFHGPQGDYRDSYSSQYLQERAEDIKQWTRQGKDVYTYFNNTMGNAFENAHQLKRILGI